MNTDKPASSTRVFTKVESLANKIPHPFILFVYLSLITMVLSLLVSWIHPELTHPKTGQDILVKSIISWDGLAYFLTNLLKIVTSFRPLGLVFIMVVAVGLAEKVGLIEAVLKTIFRRNFGAFLVPAVAFISILGNLVSDSSLFLIPPIAALVFKAQGRNPVVGIFVAFISASAGFTANVLITGTDVLLSGISTEVMQTFSPGSEVSILANWFFMSASTVIVTIIITFVTHRYLEPNVERFDLIKNDEDDINFDRDVESERALKRTKWAALIYIGVVFLLVFPENSGLRNPATHGLLPALVDDKIVRSPFLDSIIAIIAFFFLTIAITYGYSAKTIKTVNDIPLKMTESVKAMSGFFVMLLSISIFIAMLKWSNLSLALAVSGGNFLASLPLSSIVILLLFILLAGIVNLFIFSGSAQWALMAPIFLPMLVQLGIEPESVQAAYRIADSSTNIISPTSPYLAMNLIFVQRYIKDFKFGNLIVLSLPYVIFLLSGWVLFYVAWYFSGLPFGIY